MKIKLRSFLALSLAAGALSAFAFSFSNSSGSNLKVAKADGVETYIPMTTSFFTNWTDAAGAIADTNARFWGEGYSFEALDDFYRGEAAEGWTGTLTSRTWKQSTQYVYFQLGGARDYDHIEGHTHLVFHYGDQSSDFYNNTFVENPMTLRYFKIPDEAFANLTKNSTDFDMYVEIVDPNTGGYGFANFGYLHVNQTLESTSDAMRYFLNHLSNDSREWEVNKRREIFNTYFDNAAQREVFFATVNDISDSFDNNTDFVNHWYFDHNYFNNFYGVERHFDAAISTNTYRPDAATNMPFNNNGGFFRGWYEDAEGHKSGFAASDELRYRFVSRPFVLSGTGLISVKMAGKASLHVINPSVKNVGEDADLAWIDNHALNMEGATNNMAHSGFNTTAMVNHVINLEAYVGKTIQLAITDYDTSGWSACYFDELVTNYETRPGYGVDVATQTNTSGTYYITYPDIYVNSTRLNGDNNPLGINYTNNAVNTADDNAILNHVDSSDSLAAHNVWKNYIDNVRGGKNGNSFCSDLKSNEIRDFLTAYNNLSEGAQKIVCASTDYQRTGEGAQYYNKSVTTYKPTDTYNMARTIQYFAEENQVNVTVYNPSESNSVFGFADDSFGTMMLVVGLAIISIVAFAFAISYKKKRRFIK